METLAVLSTMPFTKSEQTRFAEQAIEEILSGHVSPIEADLRLKAVEEVIKKIRKDKKVAEYVIEEAEKFGKSFNITGVKIEVSQKTTRDFTCCGDAVYNDLLKQVDDLKKQIAAREAMLATGVNPETGETFSPPKTECTRFIKYTF